MEVVVAADTETIIREATKADLPQIAKLAHALAVYENKIQPLSKIWSEIHFIKLYTKYLLKKNHKIFVAIKKEEVVGYLNGYTKKPSEFLLKHKKTAYVDYCFVKPKARNKKIGKKLLQAFEKWCKKQGVTYADLIVLAGNNAIHVWEQLGYRPRAIIMHKILK